jgi:hypothetical protein
LVSGIGHDLKHQRTLPRDLIPSEGTGHILAVYVAVVPRFSGYGYPDFAADVEDCRRYGDVDIDRYPVTGIAEEVRWDVISEMVIAY